MLNHETGPKGKAMGPHPGRALSNVGGLMYTRDGLFECVNRGFPYLARGCVVILAMLFVVTAELSASTSWSAVSIPAPSTQTVDRAAKRDRLPLHRHTVLNSPAKLPVGCESVISSVDGSPLAQMARTCQS